MNPASSLARAAALVGAAAILALALGALRTAARPPAGAAAPVARESGAGAPHPPLALAPTSPPEVHAVSAVTQRASSPVFDRPAQAGMIVGVDPETGVLGPATAAQIAELSDLSAQERSMLSRSTEGLVEVRHPNGSVTLDLQGRFREFAVARIGSDGRPVLQCLDDSAAIRRALSDPAPAPASAEDR